MKVVIVGGYGAFGSLLARLLARDGHQLWLAGRNPAKGRALAAELGAETLAIDLAKDAADLFRVDPDVVIDAAGPFQRYGDDPYSIARMCIAKGCHYLDLSDSAEFTKGITTLDQEAKAKGVFVLSGASSVPGLSSIVVDDLTRDLDELDEIDIAILPGNRAPRGMSVIKSVVSGVGRPVRVFQNGEWADVPGWTDRNTYQLDEKMTRAGYLVDVPDIALLPERTGANSVMFRAGFELPVMNWSLSILAILRRWWRLELPELAYKSLHVLSKALLPFGSDRGGMQVKVTGQRGREEIARQWTLIAEDGHGPFVPGIVCRAILRNLNDIPSGARPCLAELSRSTVEDALSDLSITINIEGNYAPECRDYHQWDKAMEANDQTAISAG